MTYKDATGKDVTWSRMLWSALRGGLCGAAVASPIGWYVLNYQSERAASAILSIAGLVN